ncbi:MAG: hypothetical protein ACE3L7_01680 [Candidatus Pristimantibacillus sp.]
MYHVNINGKVIEHDLKAKDRIAVKGDPEKTGTIRTINSNGVIVVIDWDEQHCIDRLGINWLPSSIEKIS